VGLGGDLAIADEVAVVGVGIAPDFLAAVTGAVFPAWAVHGVDEGSGAVAAGFDLVADLEDVFGEVLGEGEVGDLEV